MKLSLDWRAYDAYGEGDAYAALPKSGEGFGKAAAACIGSRQCQRARGEAGDKGVMCPSFRVTQDDAQSTRGRAAVLRAALDGELGDRPFAGHALDAAMDLCVACKGCKRECPNGVDMAALRAETLAQRWRHRPVPWRTRLFARLPHWLPRLSRMAPLIGLALTLREHVPLLASLIQRLTGLSAHRRLPRPVRRPFLQRVGSRALEPETAVAPVEEVALLVDCFSNHLEPEVADAALKVLLAAGVRVHPVRPARPGAVLCCGRTAWSSGLIDDARDHARGLLAALQPHLDAGRTVIGLEPSCLSMLRDEYQMLGLPPEALARLAGQSMMLEEWLAKALNGRVSPLQWRDAGGSPVLVHGHCHQKAFGTLKALRKVLAQVPELQVQWIESSCCGMAGSFGYEAEHHAASLAMAELALLPALRAAPETACILASGTSCRQQIRDGSGREPLHLAQVLAQWLPGDAAAPPAVQR